MSSARQHAEREEQRSFDLLRSALNEANRAAFDAMPIEQKRWLVDEAFKDGILTYDAPYTEALIRSRCTCGWTAGHDSRCPAHDLYVAYLNAMGD